MPLFQDNSTYIGRLKWLKVCFAAAFVLLFCRLWSLSVLQSGRFQQLADRNHIRTVPLNAPRGLIYDREGRVLVDNVYSSNLVLYPDQLTDLRRTLDFLVKGLNLDRPDLEERIEGGRSYSAFRPIVVKENLPIEEIAYILAHQTDHPELGIDQQPRRIYRYGSLAAHVLGYVGEVSMQQLKQPEFAGTRPGDIVGEYGVERTYNQMLTGRDGYSRVLVNSVGKTLREIARRPPTKGKGLRLSLDLDLQRAAEQELGDRPGAVVLLDPRSGEVLSMVSHPEFDPNKFALRLSREEWQELISNPKRPLQNRAIQSSFSPGSIFKIIMAVAGLEAGVITPQTTVYCSGKVQIYGHWFHCWKEGGHGRVDLREAIQHSCNVYFYELGQKLGIAQISRYSRLLGLGRRTGIDLFGEIAGLVPSPQWKETALGKPWYAGETISVAIGQGPTNVTPVQLARSVAMIATGREAPLHLVAGHTGDEGMDEGPAPLPFDDDNLGVVRQAMWKVVNQSGTGGAARVAGFQVSGKTGTAQIISRKTRSQLSKGAEDKFEPNAWFVGFAPVEHPEVVISVIVQGGGGGGSVAAPLAGKILRYYYEKYHGSESGRVNVAMNETGSDKSATTAN